MVKKTGLWLRELAPTTRGSHDVGSHNLGPAYLTIPELFHRLRIAPYVQNALGHLTPDCVENDSAVVTPAAKMIRALTPSASVCLSLDPRPKTAQSEAQRVTDLLLLPMTHIRTTLPPPSSTTTRRLSLAAGGDRARFRQECQWRQRKQDFQ